MSVAHHRNRSVDPHRFSMVPKADIPRSAFDRQFTHKTTFDAGYLIPIYVDEVLPGDTIQQHSSMLLRVSPLVAPVMHPVSCRLHHWFVPYRLLWSGWEDFITGGPDGLGGSSGAYPTIAHTPSEGSLGDYLGIPAGVASLSLSALPFRAYALIWNEFYRDQDLQTKVGFSDASGVDSTTSTLLQRACWEKDYFTVSRPWQQKGAALTVPLGVSAPVKTQGTDHTTGAASPLSLRRSNDGATNAANLTMRV